MDRIDSLSLNLEKNNIDKIKQLFPEAVEEGKINFEMLRAMLGDDVDDSKEKYQFTWNGKAKSIKLAQTPSSATLRPCKEKSKNWDKTENLYIEGDNLEVLKQFQKTYYGKIKMIYIDPPYNTGKDFVYNDSFSNTIENYKEQTNQVSSSNPESNGRFHTDWLNMMYPRLILAKNLLANNGVIIISIDDNEVANLKEICMEIFGESNFISQIVLENDSRARPYGSIATTHEYALIFSKSSNVEFNILNDPDKKFKYNDEIGGFDLYELRNRNVDFNVSNRPNLYYPFYLNPNSVDENGLYEISLDQKKGFVEVYPQESKGIKTVWRWGKEKASQNLNTVLFGKLSETNHWQIVKKYRKLSYVLNSVWTDKEIKSDRGTLEVKKIFDDKKMFDFPKPIALIERFMELFLKNNDIVLDFFSGSGTTAHALMDYSSKTKKNIKYILVQLPELTDSKSFAFNHGYKTICDIAETRMNRAGEKIKSDWEKEHPSDGLFGSDKEFTTDIGFKVFKLDSTNVNEWDPNMKLDEKELALRLSEVFKEGRSKEDILYEIMLKYGVFDKQVEEINANGKTMYRVGKRYMIVCLEDSITSEDVKAIGELSPKTVIFNEAGFNNDNDKINAVYNLEKCGVEDVKCI